MRRPPARHPRASGSRTILFHAQVFRNPGARPGSDPPPSNRPWQFGPLGRTSLIFFGALTTLLTSAGCAPINFGASRTQTPAFGIVGVELLWLSPTAPAFRLSTARECSL